MLDATWQEMIRAAQAVRGHKKISDYVEAGGVSAAILSASGKIYTGVCVDTACTLGICAERNAILHMITCGEYELRRVVCVMGDGRIGGAPCGACRELMVQLMPDRYRDILILTDDAGGTVTLGALTPGWWI